MTLREAQEAFSGKAERIGLENEDDIVAIIIELKKE